MRAWTRELIGRVLLLVIWLVAEALVRLDGIAAAIGGGPAGDRTHA
jgi:hypothetical protein